MRTASGWRCASSRHADSSLPATTDAPVASGRRLPGPAQSSRPQRAWRPRRDRLGQHRSIEPSRCRGCEVVSCHGAALVCAPYAGPTAVRGSWGARAGEQLFRSVGLLVGLSDVGGNAAPVIDLVVVLSRPCPKRLSAGPVGQRLVRSARHPCPAELAPLFNEGSKRFEQLVIVIRHKVDLVIYPVQGKGVCLHLFGFCTREVIRVNSHDLLSHRRIVPSFP
jgi:Flp pilus assembly protein, ATPase CpaE